MIYLSNRDGNGKTSEEGHYRLQTRMLKGFNLFVDDLKVVQNNPLAMNVKVSVGDYRIETGAYAYTGWLDAEETITIPTANTSNPRIDTIVLYVDKSATTNPNPPNNPNIAKLVVVSGVAAATPTAPNSTAIQTAVGALNPYYALANVTVAANATQITTANITDLRVPIGIQNQVLQASDIAGAILPIVYPIGSIYINATNAANPATYLGFGTWVAYASGRMILGAGTSDATYAAGSTGGASTVTLTTAQIPSHTHPNRWQVFFPSGTGSLAINDRGGDGVMVTDNAAGGEFYGSNFPIANSAGGGGAHTNMPPYITAYAWQRTA